MYTVCETTKFTLLLIFIWVELRDMMKNTTVLAFLILIGEVMARGGRGRGGRARRSLICAGLAPGIAFIVFGFLSIYKCRLTAGQAVSAQAKVFKHGYA